MIAFLTGPMLWISLLVFFGGLTVRAVMYVRGLSWQLDRVAYKPHMSLGLRGAIHSIRCWLIPGGTYGWRQQPFMAAGFFLFHIGAILLPLFLLGHQELLKMAFGFSLPTLPSSVADALTVLAIIGGLMLAIRRIALPEVRILTTPYDWFILAISVAPFVTGFIARLHLGNYDFWLVCHILTGEAVLLLAPFTKLSHIVLFFMSRGQLGMDYNIKRGGAKRDTAFPW
jgi:nitrate reductase gamma subunit